MADLTLTCTVTRTELSLGDLSLEAAGTYRVVSVGPGAQVWRRENVISPFVEGAVLLSAVRDMMTISLVVRAYGATAAALETNTSALLAALSQFSYSMTLTIDGVAHTWVCWPADYSTTNSGDYEGSELRSKQQQFSFLIPRQPKPTAGSI